MTRFDDRAFAKLLKEERNETCKRKMKDANILTITSGLIKELFVYTHKDCVHATCTFPLFIPLEFVQTQWFALKKA